MSTILFMVPGHIEAIIAGKKTQTRRLLKRDDRFAGNVLYRSGMKWYKVGGEVLVKPKRGGGGIGYIQITDMELETVYPDTLLSVEDALEEGGYTPQQYDEVWKNMYPDTIGQIYQRIKLVFRWVGDGVAYSEIQRNFSVPLCKRGATVQTPDGVGTITKVSLIQQVVGVSLVDFRGTFWYQPDEIQYTGEVMKWTK